MTIITNNYKPLIFSFSFILVEEHALSKSISSHKNASSLAHVFRELINSDKNPTLNNNSSQSAPGNQQTLFFRINVQQHGPQVLYYLLCTSLFLNSYLIFLRYIVLINNLILFLGYII